MIRFWDTSALVKVYNSTENGHRAALRLLHGARARRVQQTTSMIALVELVAALVRRTGDRDLARSAARQLEAFGQAEFTARHRDEAVRLALSGAARGADTAIAAQALILAAAAGRSEFLTADEPQALLVEREAVRRGLDLTTVRLPV